MVTGQSVCIPKGYERPLKIRYMARYLGSMEKKFNLSSSNKGRPPHSPSTTTGVQYSLLVPLLPWIIIIWPGCSLLSIYLSLITGTMDMM